MNCAFHALTRAMHLNLSGEEAEDMERYYSVLRRATGGDTGIYVGCACWALNSVIAYGRRLGCIHRSITLSMWYADWVDLSGLIKYADNELARKITHHWWKMADNHLPSSALRQKFIVFDLATGHASYQSVSEARFPMAAMWVTVWPVFYQED